MLDIKAIFFDLDDTIVNSRKAEKEAICELKKTFKEFDKIKAEEFEKEWYKNALELYEKYNRREITFERQRIDRVKRTFSKYNIIKNDEEALSIFQVYLKYYEKNWQLFSDTGKVLDELKEKYKLGIITNGDGIQQRQKIEKTNIKNYFSEIIISSELGISKPDKKIFEIACEKIKENPQNCIMVGDNYLNDIQGALNAGFDAILINRNKKEIEYENQITQLKELLNKLQFVKEY